MNREYVKNYIGAALGGFIVSKNKEVTVAEILALIDQHDKEKRSEVLDELYRFLVDKGLYTHRPMPAMVIVDKIAELKKGEVK